MSELTHAPAPRRFAIGQLADGGQLVLGLILVALCVGISIGAPQFYSEANIIAILRQCALVLIVASGMTNRQIAAQLYLSPRTIDYHLRKVFTKLGIGSRKELRVALGTGHPGRAD